MEDFVTGRSSQALGADTRKSCLQALVGMRRKGAMDTARYANLEKIIEIIKIKISQKKLLLQTSEITISRSFGYDFD